MHIVGFAARAPSAASTAELASRLKSGEDMTTSDTRYPPGHLNLPPRQGRIPDAVLEAFEPSFFGLSINQAESMDPAIRLLLVVSYEALLDARVDIGAMKGSQTGVYVGHCFSDVCALKTSSGTPKKTGYEIVNGAHSMAANRLSYFYDVHGPSMTIDTACSSSLVALDRAVADMERGLIDRAIVCGLSLTLDPHKNDAFRAFTMLSPDGRCYSFDARANGYCRSDGVACVVVERAAAPYRCATIAGIGTNSDGATPEGITFPSGAQQESLMRRVLGECGLSPSSVVYHEAHGTGTVAGDKQELGGLASVYQHNLTIGSIKSNMGHAEGASGLLGVVKILLMYAERKMYPNHDFQTSPHSPIQSGQLTVQTRCEEWSPGPASLSNFGFGGSNAFAVLLPPPPPQSHVESVPPSAAFGNAAVQPLPPHAWWSIQRAVGNDRAFALTCDGARSTQWRPRGKLVFLCSGQGSQWNGMGRDLMRTSAPFRQTMERLERQTGIPLCALYTDGEQWMSKENAVLGIVSYQLGMIAVLRERGIVPDLYLGHSLGEALCGYLAGFQTEAEVMIVAKVRSDLAKRMTSGTRLDVYDAEPPDGYDDRTAQGQWVKLTPVTEEPHPGCVASMPIKGKMVAVGCKPAVLQAAIEEVGCRNTRIACYNSPSGLTLSGDAVEVDQVVSRLRGADSELFLRELDTDGVAYHAPYLSYFRGRLLREFGSCCSTSTPLPPEWLSTSNGSEFNSEYLCNNLVGAVQFTAAVQALPQGATVLEIGPSGSLLSQVKRTRPDLGRMAVTRRLLGIHWAPELTVWANRTEQPGRTQPVDASTVSRLPVKERFGLVPTLWNTLRLQLPSWEDFEGRNDATITFKYQSVVDHRVRGQNLFPAAGYVWALASLTGHQPQTEIQQFRIRTPLLLRPKEDVTFRLRSAGAYTEVWDEDGAVCHASGLVSVGSARLPTPSRDSVLADVSTPIARGKFYPHIRRLGYEYGASYQLLDQVTSVSAQVRPPTDWVSYMDALLHLLLLDATNFAYPVGIRRVVLGSVSNLHEADLAVERVSQDTVRTGSVLLEGVRMECAPVVGRTLHPRGETFVEYSDADLTLDPAFLAAALYRTHATYTVPTTSQLTHQELQAVVEALQAAGATQGSSGLRLSDTYVAGDGLLLTAATPPSHCVVVARWNTLCLVRDAAAPACPIVTKWSELKEVGPSAAFVWHGAGSVGAVASFHEEEAASQGRSHTGYAVVGLEKGMRYNDLLPDGRCGTWVESPVCGSLAPQPTAKARLVLQRPGHLDSLTWQAFQDVHADCRVHAAALNFRDVMRAMGQLKEADTSVGLEFSGTQLDERGESQRVFGVGKHALSTMVRPYYVYPTPSTLSDAEAATIPIVYLTVYYALLHKAGLRAGQSVLIHAGTGGVGMAAIRVAQSRGLRVLATCSAPKRAYLRDLFGLDDDSIGDSRSSSFYDTVMAATNGRGVDAVLNQLSGELQQVGLRCLAPGGHFCEIGKYDVLQDTAVGQAVLERNISLHVIDLLPLLSNAAMADVWTRYLDEGFAAGEIQPLPVTTYPPSAVEDAFRCMSQGKHRGKLVLTGLHQHAFQCAPILPSGERHLVTGGLGGLGLSLATRLAHDGAAEVVLVGRSGITSGFQRYTIQNIQARTECRVTILQSDVRCLQEHAAGLQIDRIWHVATVYNDGLFQDMTTARWDAVVETKVAGYQALRRCFPTTKLVAVSSVVGYYGNAGQTHYGFANAWLDDAARHDPNTLTVRLGALDNVGYVTAKEGRRALLERLPFQLMRVDDVLDALTALAATSSSGVFTIAERNVRTTTRSGPYTLADAQALLAKVLGGDPDCYAADTALSSVGLDSLSTMEVVHHLNDAARGGGTFKPSMVHDAFCVSDMVTFCKDP